MVERIVGSAKGRAGFFSDFFLPAHLFILTAAILIFFSSRHCAGSALDCFFRLCYIVLFFVFYLYLTSICLT
jgi:hypothetical protein